MNYGEAKQFLNDLRTEIGKLPIDVGPLPQVVKDEIGQPWEIERNWPKGGEEPAPDAAKYRLEAYLGKGRIRVYLDVGTGGYQTAAMRGKMSVTPQAPELPYGAYPNWDRPSAGYISMSRPLPQISKAVLKAWWLSADLFVLWDARVREYQEYEGKVEAQLQDAIKGVTGIDVIRSGEERQYRGRATETSIVVPYRQSLSMSVGQIRVYNNYVSFDNLSVPGKVANLILKALME